ncbi:MAG: hypothetical protein PSY14_16545 [bacterium]|nr:hypothetical protein [bacterium]
MSNQQKVQPSKKPQGAPNLTDTSDKKALKDAQDMKQKKTDSDEKKGGCCG